MKKGYKGNIEKLTEENNDFRHVLYTGEHSQLVLMTLQKGEEIGEEIHAGNDQFFRFESGMGKVIINETTYEVSAGDAVIIPSGAKHNIINVGDGALKMYTIYAPAHHKDGTIQKTKIEAEASHEEFDSILSE